MKNRIIAALILLTTMISSSSLRSANVPLSARDPFKANNFHDVVQVLSMVKKLLDHSGGRLQTDEIGVFFSAFNSRSILLRASLGTEEIQLVSFDKSDNGQATDNFEKWSIDIREELVKCYVNAGTWISANKYFDTSGMECDVPPPINVYVISGLGIGVIEQAIHKTLLSKFLNATSILMSEPMRDSGGDLKKNNEIAHDTIHELRRAFTPEAKSAIEIKPFMRLELPTVTPLTGMTQESFERRLKSGRIDTEGGELQDPFK
jgi:hypothetical protein